MTFKHPAKTLTLYAPQCGRRTKSLSDAPCNGFVLRDANIHGRPERPRRRDESLLVANTQSGDLSPIPTLRTTCPY